MTDMCNFNDLLLQMNDDLNELNIDEDCKDKTNCKVDIDNKINENININYDDQTIISNINEQCNYNNFNPSNPRVSTMTATASINLDKKDLDFVNKEIIYKYFCSDCMRLFVNKINHKCEKVKKKSSTGGFYNQLTLLMPISNGKKKNIKLFWNGKIQFCGLQSKDEAYEAINNLIAIIKQIYEKDNSIIKNIDNLEMHNFNICCINTDFVVGFKIKRNILYELLKQKYKITVSYEPDFYQGVNSKFYWNEKWNKQFNYSGRCYCQSKICKDGKKKACNGKGKGNGERDCKKVTIAIFQSGKIIITGARNFCQIKDAYLFINNVLNDNYDRIKRKEITIQKTDDLVEFRKIYIDTRKITNFHLYQKLIKV